jgi:hypothetical protein
MASAVPPLLPLVREGANEGRSGSGEPLSEKSSSLPTTDPSSDAKEPPRNPLLDANPLSILWLIWLDPLMRLGAKRPLQVLNLHYTSSRWLSLPTQLSASSLSGREGLG